MPNYISRAKEGGTMDTLKEQMDTLKEQLTETQKKRAYVAPILKTRGMVLELTATGLTNTGNDKMSGSVGGPTHPKGLDRLA